MERSAAVDVALEAAAEARPNRGVLTHSAALTLLLGVSVALLAWPIRSIVPTTGPDPSWAAGLYMAHTGGLDFGSQVVFSYGPLGFLQEPALYDTGLWTVAFLYQAVLQVAAAVSLLWGGRRALPLAFAVIAAYAVLVIGYLEGEAVLVAFIWCFLALDARPAGFEKLLVVFGGSLLAAVELLGKLNFGVAVIAFCVITLLGSPDRRRSLAAFGAVLSASFFGLWLASGQLATDLPTYLSRSVQVVGGYSAAMGANIGSFGWQIPFALGAVAVLVGVVGFVGRREATPARLASVALVVAFGFLTFKQGFVRQGLGNTSEFFALVAGAGIVVASKLSRTSPKLPWVSAPLTRSALATVLVGFLLALAMATLPTPSVWGALKPGDHVAFLRQEIAALASSSERSRLQAQGRAKMRARYRLDRRTRRMIGARPVAVLPWEIGVAWAYELNWQPLPVIQNYLAYTPALDAINARAIASPSAPALILRQNTTSLGGGAEASIDDRFGGWDSPAAMRAMLCHYRALRSTRTWQLLGRTTNRCGRPRLLLTRSAKTGEPIAVPAPPGARDVVFAKIDGLGPNGWEAIESALYRLARRSATVNGGSSWRLVAATAGDGLLLRSAPGLDYRGPFRLSPSARTLTLEIEGHAARPLSVRFYAQRLAAPGSARAAVR